MAILGWMTGCAAEAPVPATTSAPPPSAGTVSAVDASGPQTIALGPPEPSGGMQAKGVSHAALRAHPDGLIDHPQPDSIEQFLPVRFGETRLAFGFASEGETWTVSADLDADGAISPGETAVMVPSADGELTASLAGSVLRDQTPVPVTVRVNTHLVDGVRVFGAQQNARRSGVLPDGTKFAAYTSGGVFDSPGAHVIVDENGDGAVDSENWLVSYSVADGIVEAHGRRWRFTLAPDGSTLSLVPTEDGAPGLRVGSPAPPFSVVASDGTTHDLARYGGAPLLLDFWATWCAPCIALHPQVEALAAEYQLAVLGISADDDQTALNRWLQRHPTPWPSVAIGPEGAVNTAYGVAAWPTHALIDGDGKLVVLGTFASVQRALKETR